MTQQDNAPAASGGQAAASTPGRSLMRGWLNKNMKIVLSDGRILVGIFLCTDKDANVIMGSCTESMGGGEEEEDREDNQSDPRVLGLAMVPGKHIVSIHVDQDSNEVA